MYISSLNHLLRSRLCNIIPFIYNGYHYAIFSKKISSLYFLLDKQSFTQERLTYPVNKLLGEKCKECLIHSQSIRFKSSKSKKNNNKDEDSSEESDDEEDEANWFLVKGKNFKDMKVKIPSLRMDAVLKGGLAMSRNKIEESFYGGKIRINRSKPKKKSTMVQIGDILDVAKEDGESGEVSRVILLKVGEYNEKNDRFTVLIRKFPKLLPDDLDNEEYQ